MNTWLFTITYYISMTPMNLAIILQKQDSLKCEPTALYSMIDYVEFYLLFVSLTFIQFCTSGISCDFSVFPRICKYVNRMLPGASCNKSDRQCSLVSRMIHFTRHAFPNCLRRHPPVPVFVLRQSAPVNGI